MDWIDKLNKASKEVITDLKDSFKSNTFVQVEHLERSQLVLLVTRTFKKNILKVQLHDSFNNNATEFFNELIKFEDKHSYKTEKRKTIYAERIDILLPKSISTNKQKKRLVQLFMNQLSSGHFKLNYIAFEYTKGKGQYIGIVFTERMYYKDIRYKKYRSNIYVDPLTKQTCSKSTPGAIKIKKAGTLIRKDGKKIVDDRKFSNKCRIMSYSNWNTFISELRRTYKQAIQKIVKGNKRGFLISTMPIKIYWHRYLKHKVILLNRVKKYIEYYLNLAQALVLQDGKDEFDNISEIRGKTYIGKEAQEKSKMISDLYFRYMARFKKFEFHVLEKKFDINPMNRDEGSYNEYQESLKLLIEMFNTDIRNIHDKIIV